MATETSTNLITRAAAAADMEDNFVTPTQWLAWANVENRMLAAKVARMGYPYKISDESITFTGASQYSMAEPLALLAVYFAESDASLRKLVPLNPVDERKDRPPRTGSPDEYIVHRNTSATITFRFYPNPASGSGVARTLVKPDTLVLASPSAGQTLSVDYPLGWEERIVLGMARRALAKEETVNPLIETLIRDVDTHIEMSCRDYQMDQSPVIRDVRKQPRMRYDQWTFF